MPPTIPEIRKPVNTKEGRCGLGVIFGRKLIHKMVCTTCGQQFGSMMEAGWILGVHYRCQWLSGSEDYTDRTHDTYRIHAFTVRRCSLPAESRNSPIRLLRGFEIVLLSLPCFTLTTNPQDQEATLCGVFMLNDKIYPFWPLPQFSDSQIRSQLAREHFALELRALLKNRQSICASSDGTDASESSTVQLIRFLKMQMTTVRVI